MGWCMLEKFCMPEKNIWYLQSRIEDSAEVRSN